MTGAGADAVKVLVVEDETFVALDLVMQLEDEGFECYEPCSSVDGALEFLETNDPDIAILDANLRGETPRRIAEALRSKGIPFVYVSGYGWDYISRQLPVAPLVAKPVRMTFLLNEMSAALGARSG
ncbi:CheY-like chemotaxis protein [Palleronia aestuarii]|uniref:CheY-like chemotaxis protein n=1 Tax=Palleronia aestuarii TaxID=568105 RepID=A0A2W7NEF1_9RHOB|nr:response regulator [Palleronia aestuarii]PZX18811.1 CheY-like chemotaxis protein [Palleronia aestuarii]